jgi:hypothetical protein
MPTQLESHVYLYTRVGRFATQPALLELDPDNILRLTLVDAETGAPSDVLFNERLGDVRVGGPGSYLSLRTRAGKWRVDFSKLTAASVLASSRSEDITRYQQSDVLVWVTRLKELGYPTHFWSVQRLWLIGIIIGVVAVAVSITLANLLK